jgi:hypothetical protein
MTTTAGMRRGPRFSPVGVAFGVGGRESSAHKEKKRGVGEIEAPVLSLDAM